MDDFRADHKAKLDELVLPMPGVKGSKAFGYPAYKVNGKIFAFVGGNGATIKLPAARVQELIGTHPAYKVFEVTTGVFWKEWLAIDHSNSNDFDDDVQLLEESLVYVASK
jgi:hypothetical protein